jgi:Ca-activated chloride channel family protein
MSFAWPLALLVLLAAPLLLGALWLVRRRRRKLAVRVSNIAVIRAAIPGRAHWRRRSPLILLVASLVVLGVGAGRPTVTREVARSSTSILLAMDVSRSMCSTDVDPNRLVVAQQAARQFVEDEPKGTRIGLVAFAGIAGLIVPPTAELGKVVDAIDRLSTARGTAIGMAILASLDAIAEHNPNVQPTGVDLGQVDIDPSAGQDVDVDALPAATGPFEPDTIVVLTDGANTLGVQPLVAAEQAAARHVRVYTIGFGTTEPSQPVCNIDQVGRDVDIDAPIDIGGGGGGGPGGMRRFLQIDEPTLQGVAKMTGGEYFRAEDAEQLGDVFEGLPRQVETQTERDEITVWFVLDAALLASAAIGLSLAWNRH